jgi:hypothetical protein
VCTCINRSDAFQGMTALHVAQDLMHDAEVTGRVLLTSSGSRHVASSIDGQLQATLVVAWVARAAYCVWRTLLVYISAK